VGVREGDKSLVLLLEPHQLTVQMGFQVISTFCEGNQSLVVVKDSLHRESGKKSKEKAKKGKRDSVGEKKSRLGGSSRGTNLGKAKRVRGNGVDLTPYLPQETQIKETGHTQSFKKTNKFQRSSLGSAESKG